MKSRVAQGHAAMKWERMTKYFRVTNFATLQNKSPIIRAKMMENEYNY